MPIEPQFRFKRFQREDHARSALHDGLIVAHDTGLGKSIAGLTWPLLKVGFDKAKGCIPLKPVLLVALPSERVHVCDLNCGADNLLFASAQKETRSLLGGDIDPCREGARRPRIRKWTGSATVL